MSKWTATQEQKEAAAGALMVLGGMLYEWGLPLDRALEGLRRAYEIEAAKQVHACTCRDERDKELCLHKNHCAKVEALAMRDGIPRHRGPPIMSGWFVRGLLLSGWKPYTLEDQKRDERAARAKKKLAAERKAARKKK